MRVLSGLAPERVFYYFEDICSIPHGSGNTYAISRYCIDFAKAHGLEWYSDELNNVVIRKKASKGYEEHPTVIIQGHLDMVCEKDSGCTIDFEKDGLSIGVLDDWIYANGTTLGGDDGIAVAMAFAILEDEGLAHPPLEVVLTTDEETGMFGADGLDTTILNGKTLINIDSEQEGILTVSCAGGARADVKIPLESCSSDMPTWRITLDGLIGGHSGAEINKGRLNANICLGKFLSSLKCEYLISDISGGLKDNAIPRSAECVIACNQDITAAAQRFIKENSPETDPGMRITVNTDRAQRFYSKDSTKKITAFLSTVINGIQGMSKDINGLVETSLNLGVLLIENDTLSATFAVRSSVNTAKMKLLSTLQDTAKAFGGECHSHSHYPAWEYRKESRLRDTMISVYKDIYGSAPQVEAIHAGLECGLFCDKISGLDAVSFGPDMEDIHTARERLSISSVGRCYRYLLEVLKRL